MTNPLLSVSANTRTGPLSLPGVIFLNDIVLVEQALDVLHHENLYGDKQLNREAIGLWRSGVTRLLAAVIYADEVNFGRDCEAWTVRLPKIRQLAYSAAIRVVNMSKSFARLCATKKGRSYDEGISSELLAQISSLAKDAKVIDEALPEGISINGWKTFSRNIPLKFAKERFPALNFDCLPPQTPSKEGTALLGELYDRLFTDVSPEEGIMTAVVAFQSEEFVSLLVKPLEVPCIRAASAIRAKAPAQSQDNFSCTPSSFIVRCTDIEASRQALTAYLLKPLMSIADSIIEAQKKADVAVAIALQKELTVSVEKAKALVDALTPEELLQLRALLAKGTVLKPKKAATLKSAVSKPVKS